MVGILLLIASVLVGCNTNPIPTANAQPATPGLPVEAAPPPVREQHQDKLQGIDVSHYQGLVNWETVKETGISFALAKATGGTGYVDSQFQNNWHGMREAGLIRGAYHFFYANEDPIAQAEHFIQTVKSLQISDLPPMLDIEVTEGVPTETIVTLALEWMKYVEQKLGKKPMIYSDVSFYKTYLAAGFQDYGLWVAEYSDAIQEPDAGRSWEIWQYSESGHINGVNGNVDLDVFNGDENQLREFLRGVSTQPAATTTPAKPAVTATPVVPSGRTHTVKPGENLYRIALQYNTTVAAIAAANGITNPNRIRVGQVLNIP